MAPRRVLFALVSVVVSTLLALVAAELALRLIFPDRVSQPSDAEELAFEFSDSYGVRLKQSISKEFPGEPPVTWRTNRDGFRGAELRSADARVMVYGDSNVMARFSALEDSFPVQLSNELSARLERDVEVVNAGVVGFGPDQSLLKLESEIDRFQPDLVVLHVFADNDFGDLMRNRLFDIDENGRLVESGHPLQPDERFTGETRLWPSLLLVRAARKVLDGYWNQTRLESEFEVYRARGERVSSHFDDVYDADVALYPDSAAARSKRALMEAVLARARQRVERRGIPLVVVVQPAVFDLTTNLSPNHEDFAAFEGYRPSNLTRFVRESAERAGLPALDLYQPFRENDPSQLYFQDSDNHWNDRGQALAARELARFVVERGLL